MVELKRRQKEIAGYGDTITEQTLVDAREEISKAYNIDPSEVRFEIDSADIPFEDNTTPVLLANFISRKTKDEKIQEEEAKKKRNYSERQEFERLKEIYEPS